MNLKNNRFKYFVFLKIALAGLLLSSTMMVSTVAQATTKSPKKFLDQNNSQSASSIPISSNNKIIAWADAVKLDGLVYISLPGIVNALNTISKSVYQSYQMQIYIADGYFHIDDGSGWGQYSNYPAQYKAYNVSFPIIGVDAWKSGKINLKTFYDKRVDKWEYGISVNEFISVFNNFGGLYPSVKASWNGYKINMQIPQKAIISTIPFVNPTIKLDGEMYNFAVDPNNQSIGLVITEKSSDSSSQPIVYYISVLDLNDHKVIYSEPLPDSLSAVLPPKGIIGFINDGNEAIIAGSQAIDLFSLKNHSIHQLSKFDARYEGIQLIRGTNYLVLTQGYFQPLKGKPFVSADKPQISILDASTGEVTHVIPIQIKGKPSTNGVYLNNGVFAIPYQEEAVNGSSNPYLNKLMIINLNIGKVISQISIGYVTQSIAAIRNKDEVLAVGQVSKPAIKPFTDPLQIPSLYVVNLDLKKVKRIISIPHEANNVYSPLIAVSPNGKYALVTLDMNSGGVSDINVINLTNNLIESSIHLPSFNENWDVGGGVQSVTFTTNGNTALIENNAAASQIGIVSMYSVTKRKIISTKFIGYYPFLPPAVLNKNNDVWVPSEGGINYNPQSSVTISTDGVAQLTLLHIPKG